MNENKKKNNKRIDTKKINFIVMTSFLFFFFLFLFLFFGGGRGGIIKYNG